MQKNLGFTLPELAVVIMIIILLSSIVLFSVTYYVNRSKDANIQANLAGSIPVGEVYYDGPGNKSYLGFCEEYVEGNVFSRIPSSASPFCAVNISGDKWAACAKLFVDKTKAFCVDSRGVKQEIDITFCNAGTPLTQCP